MKAFGLLRLLAATSVLLIAWPLRAQEEDVIRAVPLTRGEHLRLDGRLDHPAWQRAPVYSRFVEKAPALGAAPPQATRVQVLFDEQALYVGITALDNWPEQIRGVLVRDDQVNRTQDFVVVYLDPIGSRRSAQFFRVGAAGSRGDGIHTASDDSEDFAPDFDWDAAVAPHAEGWTAVLRLPFASLRYAEGEPGRWRIMVARRLPRESFHLATSVLIPREATSFIERLQPLAGVQLPPDHGFVTLRPSLTLRRSHQRLDDAANTNRHDVESTLDVKWRPRAELVIDATVNPDFSQVALDVPQLTGNTRFALGVPEKRPFFVESADLLRTPTEAFYTRSFTEPRGGLRATWRGHDVAGSAFAVADRGGGLVLLPGPYGTRVADQPASRTVAARVRADSGALQWGAVLSARRYESGRGDNTVLGPDLQWALGGPWHLRVQWLHARTSAQAAPGGSLAQGAVTDGERVFLRLNRNTESAESSLTVDHLGAGFRHDGGFVAQNGVRSVQAFQSVGWRDLGPFHEFWLNVNVRTTQARVDGRVIEQQVYPGLYATAARNLEWWVELHPVARSRPSPTAALLAQHYVSSGLVFSPSSWFSLLDTSLSAGRLVDAQDERIRSGLRWTTSARFRPLARLELEPTWSTSWLRGTSRRVYAESALNLLAIWHLGPRSHLRAIVQHAAVDRGGDEQALAAQTRRRVASLTWNARLSAGTQVYVGASRGSEGVATRTRTSEAFVKLQFDVDDVRGWWASPS